MIQLSDKQKTIVELPISTPIQVLASAGTGKTRVLTERVRFILEQGRHECVIALTFTNKAADEMKSRLWDSDDATERAWIATIHSVAQRILEQYGHTIGLSHELQIFENDQDRMEIFIQSLHDGGIDIDQYLNVDSGIERRDRERNLKSIFNRFSLIKREMLSKEEFQNDRIWDIFEDYQNSLLESGGIDFDDILYYANRILLSHDWVATIYRTKYQHVCVDEAQDLNRLQYEFIKNLCGESISSVMMVGDPNQMIFGFNGSSSDYLCKFFPEDFSATQYQLVENYRSSKKVIEAAGRLNRGNQFRQTYALRGKFRIKDLEDEREEAKWVVSSIIRILDLEFHEEIEGQISLDNMVVIARNRFLFSCLENELSEHSIPFYLRKSERMIDPISLFGQILKYSVRIKINSRDWVDGKKLCNLIDFDPPDSWQDKRILENMAEHVNATNLKFAALYSALLTEVDKIDIHEPNINKIESVLKERLERLTHDAHDEDSTLELEQSMKELYEFSANWTKFRLRGQGTTLQHFQNALALGQLTEETSPGGLMLSTVHSMKGLEKDIVFLISMCEGVFPDYRSKLPNELEEEQNNAFVAITRARRWLFMTYPRKRTMPWGDIKHQSPSRFVTLVRETENRKGREKIAARAVP